jgi:hypothetical protein
MKRIEIIAVGTSQGLLTSDSNLAFNKRMKTERNSYHCTNSQISVSRILVISYTRVIQTQGIDWPSPESPRLAKSGMLRRTASESRGRRQVPGPARCTFPVCGRTLFGDLYTTSTLLSLITTLVEFHSPETPLLNDLSIQWTRHSFSISRSSRRGRDLSQNYCSTRTAAHSIG